MPMQDPPAVDVLMATYNGENFLSDQIDSILKKQTHTNTHLYIRDDSSNDSTQSIINQKQKEFPGKITQIPTDKRLGVIGNFSTLMQHATANYVMFADQDDIWLPEKIAKTLEQVRAMETIHGTEEPILVHTDLYVVDAYLNKISPSFWSYAELPTKTYTLNRLLMQNAISGCTVMMNKPLATLALPIPSDAMMHDWWIGLVASAMGRIGTVDEATILYRQHGKNQIGAKKRSLLQYYIQFFKNPKKHLHVLAAVLNQGALFADTFSSRLDPKHQQIALAFGQLQQSSPLQKTYLLCKHRFFRQGWFKTIQMAILLLLVPKKR
jgi:glycosyltransferase involved in cell wall biosynthesis